MIPTYSSHGTAEFNGRLHETLLRLASDVESVLGDNLVALILGGGYGRGEGAVIRVNDHEMPYNDLDLFVVVNRREAAPVDRLNEVGKPYAHDLKIHVDFSRPLTIRDIEQWSHWLMWYDLLNGHVVLAGANDVLRAHAPAGLNEPLPAIEGTKLLLNRGAGVLWGLRVARDIEPSPDEDFILRNYYKCALALGDALLISYRRYTTAYLGRDDRYAELEQDEAAVGALQLSALYRDALRFKFRPDSGDFEEIDRQGLESLAEKWGTVFLVVEEMRTGRTWHTMDEYVRWNGIREFEQNSAPRLVRNVVRNVQLGRFSLRYPREALYRSLPVLLDLTETSVADWAAETQDFLKVWDRFN